MQFFLHGSVPPGDKDLQCETRDLESVECHWIPGRKTLPPKWPQTYQLLGRYHLTIPGSSHRLRWNQGKVGRVLHPRVNYLSLPITLATQTNNRSEENDHNDQTNSYFQIDSAACPKAQYGFVLSVFSKIWAKQQDHSSSSLCDVLLVPVFLLLCRNQNRTALLRI